MEVYIQEKGSALRKEKNHFLIETKINSNCISPEKVTSIIMEDSTSITTGAIKLAIENDIPLFLSDGLGNIYAKIWKPSFGKNSLVRFKQLKVFSSKYGNKIGREWIVNKIESQKNHIIKICNRRNLNCFQEIKKFDNIILKIKELSIERKDYSNVIMGYEGVASQLYYSVIEKILPENIKFEGRVNQGAEDIYNAVLNYSFGILYTKVNHILTVAGFDTKIGIFHSNLIGKDSFLYDFIEQFRFIAWEVTFGLFSKKIFNKNYFDKNIKLLTLEGRRVILEEMYKKLNKINDINDERYSYNEFIKKSAYTLRKDLLENEIYNNL